MNESNIRVLSIGSDTKLFSEGSAVRKRIVEYGKLFKELHIIVFSLRSSGFVETQIAPNVWLYPTHSPHKLFYILDALELGKKIIDTKGLKKETAVITVQDPFESGIVGVFLKQKYGIGLQVQVHTDFLDRHFAGQLKLNRIRVFLAPFAMKHANAVRVVSERIRSQLVNAYGISKDKITVLPIFVESPGLLSTGTGERRFTDTYRDFDCIGLIASRLTREKRIDLALDAFAEMVRMHPRTGLVIVGDGPERDALERKAKSLGVEKNVFFKEWQNELSGFFRAADFFVLASSYEGYGMTLIEAALHGVPIVSTKVGIAPELIEDGKNSFLCPVGDTHCLAKGMERLVAEADLRKIFGERLREWVQKRVQTKEEYLEEYKSSLEAALVPVHSDVSAADS